MSVGLTTIATGHTYAGLYIIQIDNHIYFGFVQGFTKRAHFFAVANFCKPYSLRTYKE